MSLKNLDNLVKTNKLKVEDFDQSEFDGLVKSGKARLKDAETKFTPQELYDVHYCGRGEMENRIKEIKRGLFSDRTSCHKWWPNQLRLIFSSMAYILMEIMRRIALKNTELANAQCETIRLKLYKIGAIILRNTKRIRFLLSSNYPKQELFLETTKKLCST